MISSGAYSDSAVNPEFGGLSFHMCCFKSLKSIQVSFLC